MDHDTEGGYSVSSAVSLASQASTRYSDEFEDISTMIADGHFPGDELPDDPFDESVPIGDISSFFTDTYDFEDSVPLSATPTSLQSSLGKRKASDDIEESGPARVKLSRTSSLNDNNDQIPALEFWSHPDAPVVIAHSTRHQQAFDCRNLCWGVQWDIARLISLEVLQYTDIEIHTLDMLKGTNSAAVPQVPVVLFKYHDTKHNVHDLAFARELAAKSPWTELDLEEEMLREDPYAGLGFGQKDPEWYGGKVTFRATLKDIGKLGCPYPRYKLVLERAELGPSCRFSQRFGSWRFIRVSISKDILNKRDSRIVEYFSRPFVLNGRVFRAYFAKDHNVFLVETNELTDGSTVFECPHPPSAHGPLTLLDFLQWHNPIEINAEQTMAKYAARFALGLSNSVPGLKLDATQIVPEDEIISLEGSEMTDGCGYISKSLLIDLRCRFTWDHFPTAIQCRLGGAKGMLTLPAKDDLETPRVWLRPSQIKIHYPLESPLDPALLIVNILRSSHLKTPGRLSAETIVNLAENGVRHTVFTDLLRAALEERVAGLTTWGGRDAMYQLWLNVSRCGGVMMARQAREASGEARAKGYGEREAEDVEMEDEDGLQPLDNALRQRSAAWWADQVSGCPSTLEETVMVLLDSGFTPQNCAVLREKLKQVVTTNIKNYVLRYRIEVPMSCTAFLVPDPFGVLGKDEVQIKSSTRNLPSEDSFMTELVLGPVLLTRHPCKLPTDVRKVTAVEKPELRHFTDVIVCSVSGNRRLADFLAGGDYDGDKGLAIWQHTIVNSFNNADEQHSVEPKDIAACFSRNNERVSDFRDRIKSESLNAQIRAYQQFLLGAIRDTSVVGTYSTYHDNAIYMLGYDHPETIRLAYKFCKALDGSKTGLTILPEILKQDKEKYGKRPPEWKETAEDRERVHRKGSNEVNVSRGRSLSHRKFVMDTIYHYARKEGDRQLMLITAKFNDTNSGTADGDLIAPWLEMHAIADRVAGEEKNNRKKNDLERIKAHVALMYTKRLEKIKQVSGTLKKDKAVGFTGLDIEVRQDTLRALSKEFFSMPGADELEFSKRERDRLLASCAYWYDWDQTKRWTRFPWDVAMRELCAIKAHKDGLSKAVLGHFYEKFSIKLPSVGHRH